MKIALICAEWPTPSRIGGVGIFNMRLANELVKREHQVTIYSCEQFEDSNDFLGSNFKRIKISDGRFNRYYIFPIKLGIKLFFESRKFDRIISSGDDWAITNTKKIVRIFHGTAKGEQIDASLLRKCNHRFLFALEKLSARRIAKRFGVGMDSCNEFNASYFPPILGIEESDIAKNEKITVIFIGSFHGRKRGYLANSVIAGVRKVVPEIEFVVLTSLKDQNLFTNATRFLINVGDEVKQKEIAQASILLCTSSYEGFGIPIFEAMLEGTVPVSTLNPGSSTQLANLTELLVADEELISLVLNLILDKEKMLYFSEMCKSEAKMLKKQGSVDLLLEQNN